MSGFCKEMKTKLTKLTLIVIEILIMKIRNLSKYYWIPKGLQIFLPALHVQLIFPSSLSGVQ